MKKSLILITALVLTLTSGCLKINKNPSISEPTIAKTVDFKTSKPVAQSSSFNQTDPAVYFSIKITDLPEGTKIKAVWKHLGGITEVSSEITTSGTGYEVFTLKRNSTLFPPGQYEVTAFAVIEGKTLEVKSRFEIVSDIKATHLLNPVTSKSIDSDDKLNPVDVTSEFTQSDPVIYFIIQSRDLPKDTRVSCVWVHIDSGNTLSHELVTDGNRNIAFSLKPDGGQKLPVGKYMVTASIKINNETQSVSREFEIKK